MLITNLTGEDKYRFDSLLLEECLRDSDKIKRELIAFAWHLPHQVLQGLQILSPEPIAETPVLLSRYADAIKDVPVYLVTTNQSNKHFTIGYLGHKESFIVPEGKDNDNDKEDELNRTSIFDRWGCYTCDYPKIPSYGIEYSHPKIFIWVDMIFAHVYGDERKFNILTTMVILHELAHAMMDVHLIGKFEDSEVLGYNKQIIPEPFFSLKEESLANAVALSLIKNYLVDEEYNCLKMVVENQPSQYVLGLKLLDENGQVFDDLMYHWMLMKLWGKYPEKACQEWNKYFNNSETFDKEELTKMDKKICWP